MNDKLKIRKQLEQYLLETKLEVKTQFYKLLESSFNDENVNSYSIIQFWSKQRYSSRVLIGFLEESGIITNKESMDLQKWVHMCFGISKDMNDENIPWIPFKSEISEKEIKT